MTVADVRFQQITDALAEAESFISGFEDDDLQEGIPEMLDKIRVAIEATEALARAVQQ